MLEMWDSLSPYKSEIEGFQVGTDNLLTSLLNQTDSLGNLIVPQTSFLKSMIQQQEETAKSLIKTAKKIGPVAKKIEQSERAYDASFESTTPTSMPLTASTMQGVAVLLFTISFLTLSLITSFLIFSMTGSWVKALGSFVGFIIVGTISISLIIRLG